MMKHVPLGLFPYFTAWPWDLPSCAFFWGRFALRQITCSMDDWSICCFSKDASGEKCLGRRYFYAITQPIQWLAKKFCPSRFVILKWTAPNHAVTMWVPRDRNEPPARSALCWEKGSHEDSAHTQRRLETGWGSRVGPVHPLFHCFLNGLRKSTFTT